MKRVHVELAPAYEVLIGDGVLAELQPFSGRLALVIDENVDRLHGAAIRAAFAKRNEGDDRNKWLYSYNPLTVELT